jgi:hypothetical protein
MDGRRLVLVIVATGLGAGALGSVLASSRLTKPPSPRSSAVSTERSQDPAPVIPPGWDLALVSRLSHVEQRLGELGRARPDASPSAAAEPSADKGSDPVQAREEQRANQYQQELDYRERALATHTAEATDTAWAGPLAATMQQSLSTSFQGLARTTNVDCRTKTCTATLTFPTPSDALMSFHDSSKLSVQGCSGLAAVPTPPTSAGPYDLTLIYSCR